MAKFGGVHELLSARETTLDIRDAQFAEGHIRLQYQQYPIAFRNIKLRPLS